MIGDTLIGEGGAMLARVLDFRLMRQNYIGANIANVDTPDYKALDIQFEPQLKRAMEAKEGMRMRRTNFRHMKGGGESVNDVKPLLFATVPPMGGNDFNSVDLDREMVKMGENQIMYNAASQFVGGLFGKLKFAISEGAR